MGHRQEQIHGGDIYRNINVTDYSVNTNPLGPPEGVVRAYQKAAGWIGCYPDMWCEELRCAIAAHEGVLPEEIICGNGAAELIYAMVMAERPKRALVIAPAFTEYKRALEVVDADCSYYICQEQHAYQVQEDILDMIADDYDMLFLCNPGNPTGQTVERELLIRMLDRCGECHVKMILDECFIDFLEDSEQYEMISVRSDYPDLLVLKAFTKIFCMPGLRLGYGISADRRLLTRMRKILQPWNVSIPAQMCGIEAVKECNEYIKETKIYLNNEKNYILNELKETKIQVFGSKANYLFFKGPEGLYEQALDEGMLIRDCKSYRGLKAGYYRVAVRTHKENDRLVTWLRRL